jgi:hypothetical protein
MNQPVPAQRKISLCADDYGLTRGVSRAILFTQEEGPARRAYEAIGFQRIGDYGLVLFR